MSSHANTHRPRSKKNKLSNDKPVNRIGFNNMNNGASNNNSNNNNNNDLRHKRVKLTKDIPIPSARSINEWSKNLLKDNLINQKGINQTVSIAIPSSFIKHGQSPELRSYLVGQIARICAIYEIDEIIVFVDSQAELTNDSNKLPSHMIIRLLQYIETPAYLRKSLFPFHSDFKYAGLLPLLELTHHVRKEDNSWFREGVTITSSNDTTKVDIGLDKLITVNENIEPNMRVTIQIDEDNYTVVSPSLPRENYGLYWGYQTRLANSFSEVFSSSPFTLSTDGTNGYDLIIGQSQKGDSVDTKFKLPTFEHMLIVFGGNNGIEECIENDESIKDNSIFTYLLNLSPTYGCRSIRTEESVMATLSRLKPLINEQIN